MLEFAGYPCREIDNGLVRLGYLQRGGLRLSHLRFGDRPENLWVELPDIGWQTPNGYYRLLGGHRLWVAPECVEITYLPEPDEIIEEPMPGGIRLTQPTDVRSGLQKIIEIELADGKAGFTLRHCLVNRGEKTVTAAAWAISQFQTGGIAVLPQPDSRADAGGYLPNRSLALWPYTRLNDPRLRWMERYLMINAHVVQRPCKVGYSGLEGWVAYLLQGILLRKQVVLNPGAQYPDLNSALEIYVDQNCIELESLSPFVQLAPGERVDHEERWSLEAADEVTGEQGLAEYLHIKN
jgi:hypothetical protein